MSRYQNQMSSHKEQVRSTLGTFAREGAQGMLISALEQEVEEFRGRPRYARADGEGRGYVQSGHVFPTWGQRRPEQGFLAMRHVGSQDCSATPSYVEAAHVRHG